MKKKYHDVLVHRCIIIAGLLFAQLNGKIIAWAWGICIALHLGHLNSFLQLGEGNLTTSNAQGVQMPRGVVLVVLFSDTQSRIYCSRISWASVGSLQLSFLQS